MYRITPQSTTGAPAELFTGRKPKSRLELLRPNVSAHVKHKLLQHKKDHDKSSMSRKFNSGQPVYVKNNGIVSSWLKGRVVESTGPVSFRVLLDDGREWCHQDHIRGAELVIQHHCAMDSVVASDFMATESDTDNTQQWQLTRHSK